MKVSEVFEKFLVDNDRKIAEGADRNLKVEQLKQRKQQIDQMAAMDRFNAAFRVQKAEEAKEQVQLKRQREDEAIARKDAIRDQERLDKLDDMNTEREWAVEDREDDQNFKREMVQQRAAAKASTSGGGKELTANMVKKLNEGNAIPILLDDVSTVLEKNKDIMGPIKGNLASANPYNERAQSVNAQMRAASQAFGRFMEGGVLRKEDEDKYRKMFPKTGDTPEVAESKLATVRRLLIQRQNSDLEAFRQQGYDLTGVDKGMKVPEMSQSVMGSEATSEQQMKEMADIDAELAEIDAQLKEMEGE